MRKLLLLLCALPATLLAVEFKLDCEKPGGWKFETARSEVGGVEEFTVSMRAGTAEQPPKFSVSFDFPQIDVVSKWVGKENVIVPPNWGCSTWSRLCAMMPVVTFLNGNDANRATLSVDEAKRAVKIDAGLREEDFHLVWKVNFFIDPEAPISEYRVKLRLDRRDIFFGDAIRQGVKWIEKSAGIAAEKPPESAFEPLYSAWYSFHQNVSDREIEAECAEAARLGMKVVIVDDGWQTDDNNRGYAYTGDWEISKRRFPDMAAHVRKVHQLGMKYMIWYGVPMMGLKARNYDRFKGKYLWTSNDRWAGYSCMDPRFPEVREYICGLYEKALREWDLDGLKLDFIDAIAFNGPDPAVKDNYAGRDIRTLPEAVDRLMVDVLKRLRAIKPDVLIEFRQSYVGPYMRTYGNMLRAADCPGDSRINRMRTANLRLTSGETAVHADMLEWSREDTAENAAVYVLSTMFSVIQYSVMLRTYPQSHKDMIAHWLRFSQEHRETLLRGEFKPHHYEAGYPWIEAESASERIAGVYTTGTTVPVLKTTKPDYVLNGTGARGVIVEAEAKGTVEIYDTFGKKTGTRQIDRGLTRLDVPISGYAKILRN